jgi:WD40 repeat protein
MQLFMKDEPLQWKRTNKWYLVRELRYELQLAEQVVASLRYRPLMGSVAEVGDCRWIFKRQHFGSMTIVADAADFDHPIATIRHGKVTCITFSDGQQFLLRKKFGSREWVDQDGAVLVSFDRVTGVIHTLFSPLHQDISLLICLIMHLWLIEKQIINITMITAALFSVAILGYVPFSIVGIIFLLIVLSVPRDTPNFLFFMGIFFAYAMVTHPLQQGLIYSSLFLVSGFAASFFFGIVNSPSMLIQSQVGVIIGGVMAVVFPLLPPLLWESIMVGVCILFITAYARKVIIWVRLAVISNFFHPIRGHSDMTLQEETKGLKVFGLAWSPDGTRIASGSDDGTVQVWDAKDGGNVFTYKGHTRDIMALAWSPDGTRIVSCGTPYVLNLLSEAMIQVWDTKDGGNVLTYTEHKHNDAPSPVNAVVWSPDGTRIASAGGVGTNSSVHVWNAKNGENIFIYQGHIGSIFGAVAWSPDGTRIASGAFDGTVQVWDAKDGGNTVLYAGHYNSYKKGGVVWRGAVRAVAWSPDGTRIASGSGSDDGTAQVWNAKDGRNCFNHQGQSIIHAVAWSPDGTRIASGSFYGIVQVWDAKDGGNVFTYNGHGTKDGKKLTPIEAIVWSPDGTRIASSADDGTVQVWDAKDGGNVFIYEGHISKGDTLPPE